jgi:hypothetical protein
MSKLKSCCQTRLRPDLEPYGSCLIVAEKNCSGQSCCGTGLPVRGTQERLLREPRGLKKPSLAPDLILLFFRRGVNTFFVFCSANKRRLYVTNLKISNRVFRRARWYLRRDARLLGAGNPEFEHPVYLYTDVTPRSDVAIDGSGGTTTRLLSRPVVVVHVLRQCGASRPVQAASAWSPCVPQRSAGYRALHGF